MGFGGKLKKMAKKAKKAAAKAFSAPNKIVSNVVSKVPVVGKPVEQFLQGEGPLGSLEKYLDPGSALIKNFTNDPENFIKDLGGYKDDLGKIKDFGQDVVSGLKNMIDPPKMKEPEAPPPLAPLPPYEPPPPPPPPPKPDAPDMSNAWREYSGWMDTSRQKRDSDISMSRARLYEAGAIPDVITAHETDLRSQYDKKVAGFQSGANFKLLQEGFDIARGAKENPYAQSLKTFQKGQDLNQYFAANYASGSAEADPKEGLYRARRAAAGGNLTPGRKAGAAPGGGGGTASPDIASAPGANPWMSAA
jgi:hypothetical protein